MCLCMCVAGALGAGHTGTCAVLQPWPLFSTPAEPQLSASAVPTPGQVQASGGNRHKRPDDRKRTEPQLTWQPGPLTQTPEHTWLVRGRGAPGRGRTGKGQASYAAGWATQHNMSPQTRCPGSLGQRARCSQAHSAPALRADHEAQRLWVHVAPGTAVSLLRLSPLARHRLQGQVYL